MDKRQTNEMRRRLIRGVERVGDAQNTLQSRLESIAAIASVMLGYDVVADLCNGGEIEFRRMDGDRPEDFSCIRLEDILQD